MNYVILLFFLILLICLILLLYYYCLNKYTNYNYIIKNRILLNNDKSYLNVGFWDSENNTMEKAQKNMFKKFYNMADLNKEQTLLETGGGSGEHYLYWDSLGCKTNIDCLEKHTEPHPDIDTLKNINFQKQDATELNNKDHYNKIISIESAFHYKNRKEFFKKCYSALKQNGEIIFTDIIINDINHSIINNLIFNYYKKNILKIPKENCVNQKTYFNHLQEAGFSDITITDITDNSLVPFYKNYKQNIKLDRKNNFVPTIINYLYKYTNNYIAQKKPFQYILIRCKKLTSSVEK